MVFVVEKRTMKFVPMKQYRIVWGGEGRDHNNYATNWPKKFTTHEILPPEKYPLYGNTCVCAVKFLCHIQYMYSTYSTLYLYLSLT